jgi:hypothetical protein
VIPPVDHVRVRDILSALFGGVEGLVNLRAIRPDGPIEQTFCPIGDATAVEAFIKPRRDRYNCYIGAAARLTTNDGTLGNCGGLPALFVDLDFAGEQHAATTILTEAEARQRLAHVPLPPSLVVHSGGGLQVWWLLKEPLDLQREAADAKVLLRRLARGLDADLAAAEPARVLRLPHTFNHKYAPPRLVRVEVFEPSRRYDVTEFDSWLPDEPRDVRVLSGPTPDAIPAGNRNAHLTSLAGSMRRRGMTETSITAALLAENEGRCRPPLPEADVRRIAKSVGRYTPDPIVSDDHRGALAHSLPELLARASAVPEAPSLVEGLIPGDGSVLIHSQPREYKSLAALSLLVSVTTGRPAFCLERLHVREAVPAWYITEEDGWWRVTTRLGQLVQGYGLEHAPDLLHVSAGKGLNLDTPEWQERIIATAREQGYRLVVLDPLRSVTEAADQGPRELKPFALFLRRFMRETGAVVLIVHHDTKPPATAQDTRRRPQRASGGGIFSIADSPIHVDRVDETRRILVPCAYKFSADPPPVTVRLEHGPGWIRLSGEDATDADEPESAAVDAKIIEFLRHSPYSFGNKVAIGVKHRKDLVLARLRALEHRGLVDSVEESRGVKWFLRRAS